jgi:hypothetical protein
VWQANVTTVPVAYGGSTPLLPDSDYAWVVRWWDGSGGEASSWSNVSMFSTGHLHAPSHHTSLSSWEAMGSEACASLASLHGKRWEARLAPHLPLFTGSDGKRVRVPYVHVLTGKWVLVLRQQVNFFAPTNLASAVTQRLVSAPPHALKRTRSKEGPSPIAVSTSIASRKRLA